ncbi:MAG: single-stranded DNA-binding protein [Oscillospiraceae bacterium]|jgi:primosomal replication protein N|nr:single-stranded DNA-binding protein [Oscillospiraceae bacterium]
MEHIANHISLTGSLSSAPKFSHENHGRRFFSFYISVARLSGTIDELQIIASEELLESTPVLDGDCLHITGQIRSFNNRNETGRKLVISVLAESIEICFAEHDNQVSLTGVVCKEPIYRQTPLGRDICDVMLAVNRPYHRADYLPCILWGKTAFDCASLRVGDSLTLTGRLQSREYVKVLDGISERRTAYEISAITAQKCE